jgi:hypothetical protein
MATIERAYCPSSIITVFFVKLSRRRGNSYVKVKGFPKTERGALAIGNPLSRRRE